MLIDVEEKFLRRWLENEKGYNLKRPFSDKKLSVEEFSKKYWLDGECPYQYHTGRIEDGRDEREQFIFNNIRSLKNELMQTRRFLTARLGDKADRIDDCEKKIAHIKRRIRIIAVICAIYTGIIAVVLKR